MRCDCGAEKHGWTHSGWCSAVGANQDRRTCEYSDHQGCNASGPSVTLQSGRTMYHWDGTGEDPNRDVWLCPDCAKMHHEYWDEMFAMANSDKL